MVNNKPIKIEGIPLIKQMACGLDHVVFLNHKGGVMAMGDHTFGQCGCGEGRSTTAPF